MVLVQKWPFFQLFFLFNIGHENVFYDILERKNAFLLYKNKNSKRTKKLTFFQKGWPMVLVQKWPFFLLFFLRHYRPGKCLLWYSRRKNTFLGYKKMKSKVEKLTFFQRGERMVLVQKRRFFQPFFLGNIG